MLGHAAQRNGAVHGRSIDLAVQHWERTGNAAYSMVQIVDLMNSVAALIARSGSPKLTIAEVRESAHCKGPGCATTFC